MYIYTHIPFADHVLAKLRSKLWLTYKCDQNQSASFSQRGVNSDPSHGTGTSLTFRFRADRVPGAKGWVCSFMLDEDFFPSRAYPLRDPLSLPNGLKTFILDGQVILVRTRTLRWKNVSLPDLRGMRVHHPNMFISLKQVVVNVADGPTPPGVCEACVSLT